MNEKFDFGEAATLYAQNYHVVEAMRAAFDTELGGFYDRVASAVQSRSSRTMREKTTPGFRYWWFEGDDKLADLQPRLWFDVRKTEVITPGKWELTAGAPESGPEELSRLGEIALDEPFSPFCIPGSGGNWSLFSVVLNPAEQSVESMAAKVQTVLDALHETHQEFLAQASSNGD